MKSGPLLEGAVVEEAACDRSTESRPTIGSRPVLQGRRTSPLVDVLRPSLSLISTEGPTLSGRERLRGAALTFT